MRSKLLVLFVLFTNILNAQVVLYHDNMESTSTWKGVSTQGLYSSYTGGFSQSIDDPPNSPQYVSLDSCYVVRGAGAGSSTPERDTLLFPNITGLSTAKKYQVRFKLATIGVNPSVNLAAGLDQSDSLMVEFSPNNGLSWFKEIKIFGNNNARWGFNSSGVNIVKLSNFNTATYSASSASPITSVTLDISINITQLRVRLISHINAIGETIMIDDVEILERPTVLPVELLDAKLITIGDDFELTWTTISEINVDYFSILKCDERGNIVELGRVSGMSYSNTPINYIFKHKLPEGQNYIILREVDLDGFVDDLKIFSIIKRQPINDLSSVNDIYYRVNLLGQQVNDYEIIFNKTKKWFIHAN